MMFYIYKTMQGPVEGADIQVRVLSLSLQQVGRKMETTHNNLQ